MKTFVRKLFGTKTAPIRRTPRARLALESLDGRIVPAPLGPGAGPSGPGLGGPPPGLVDILTPGVRVQGGVLYVIGDAGENDHEVEAAGGDLRVMTRTWHIVPPPDIHSPPMRFATSTVDVVPAAGITRIAYYGHGDDDLFVNQTAVPTKGYGGAGDDDLVGGSGADSLDGGAGADVLEGRGGNDSLTGGTGNDTYRFAGITFGHDTVAGSAAASDELDFADMDRGVRVDLGVTTEQQVVAGYTSYLTLTRADLVADVMGSPKADDITGNGRANRLDGAAGNDTLDGAGGNDKLFGWDGNDSLVGGAGRDSLDGGAGRDTLLGGDERDTLVGGGDNDDLVGGAGNDSAYGDGGNDSLFGEAGNDTLDGGAGNDGLDGGAGNDSLRGGWGNDLLTGGSNNDKLYGGDGDDTLYGGAGVDKLYGEGGNDGLFGGAGDGAESLAGGAGADRLLIAAGDVATGLAAEDARIVFADSPALSGKKFSGQGDTLFSFAAGSWQNEDIERLDVAFGNLHRHVGNTRLLKTAGGTEMSFLAVGEQTDDNAFRVGGWNNGTQIVIVTPELKSDMGMNRTVYHEFGHNWDEASENPFAGAFRAVSGWVQSATPLAGYTASIGIGDTWQYLMSAAGTFARGYGRTNPMEDMGTTWEAYFVNEYHGGAAGLTDQGLTRNDDKWDTLDDLFISL